MKSDFDNIDWNHPLGSFEDFILKGGFREFRDKFFTEKIEQGAGWSAYYRPQENPKHGEEFMLYTDDLVNLRQQSPIKIYFQSELWDHLNYFKKESCRLIERKIDSLYHAEEISTYLKKLLIRLNKLLMTIKSDPDLLNYKTPIIVIYQFIHWLYDTYNLFLDEINSPIIIEALDQLNQINTNTPTPEQKDKIANKQPEQNDKKAITGFKWKNRATGIPELDKKLKNLDDEIDTRTLKLYRILSKNKVIPNDQLTKNNFLLVFDGSSFTAPLKIKWMLTSRSKYYKPSIVRVFDHTLIKKLGEIEDIKDRTMKANKFEKIFADSEGNSFSNFYQAIKDTPELSAEKIEKQFSQEAILIKAIIKDFLPEQHDFKNLAR